MSKELNKYIQDALTSGADKQRISLTLVNAGWSPEVVQKTLSQYAGVDENGVIIPVPRLGIHHIIRDIFVYLLVFVALSMASFSLGALFFRMVDHFLPDVVGGWRAHGSISWAIAQLVVASPLYVWLSVWLERHLGQYPQKRESLVRKLMIYFILLITAVVSLGDMISVLTKFLDGELTVRFILQAGTVLLIAGGIFIYYLLEMRRDDMLVKGQKSLEGGV